MGAWNINGTLRFAGEDAVDAVSEFVRQRHHVIVGSQIFISVLGDSFFRQAKTWR